MVVMCEDRRSAQMRVGCVCGHGGNVKITAARRCVPAREIINTMRDVLRSLRSKQAEIDKGKQQIKRLVKAMQDSAAKHKTGQTEPYIPSPDV